MWNIPSPRLLRNDGWKDTSNGEHRRLEVCAFCLCCKRVLPGRANSLSQSASKPHIESVGPALFCINYWLTTCCGCLTATDSMIVNMQTSYQWYFIPKGQNTVPSRLVTIQSWSGIFRSMPCRIDQERNRTGSTCNKWLYLHHKLKHRRRMNVMSFLPEAEVCSGHKQTSQSIKTKQHIFSAVAIKL